MPVYANVTLNIEKFDNFNPLIRGLNCISLGFVFAFCKIILICVKICQ